MSVTLIEVGPRDGLQNITPWIPTELKIDFINALSECGLQHIETTSFVSPRWVPQMKDHTHVMNGITKQHRVTYSALIPNTQGLREALSTPIDQINVFTTASQTFSEKNTHCTIEESINRIQAIINEATPHSLPIRAYLSCITHCPYEGPVQPNQVIACIERLLEMGVNEISLGETLGKATPKEINKLLQALPPSLPLSQLALHCHDTDNQAINNIDVALQHGITRFDCAAAGLGGCPYAPGAKGNVSTESVVNFLENQGVLTGIDTNQLITASQPIKKWLTTHTSL